MVKGTRKPSGARKKNLTNGSDQLGLRSCAEMTKIGFPKSLWYSVIMKFRGTCKCFALCNGSFWCTLLPQVLRCCKPPKDPYVTLHFSHEKSKNPPNFCHEKKRDTIKKGVETFSTTYRSAPSWAMRTSHIAVFQACPIAPLNITTLFQPDHHMDIYTLHRKRCRIRAIVVQWRTFDWFVMCKPLLECVRNIRITGLCTSSELQRLRENHHVQMGITAHSVSLFHGMCWALPTCVPGLAWPTHERGRKSLVRFLFRGDGRSFVSLGLLVIFACWSGLSNRGGVSGVHARAGLHNFTHK